MKKFDSGTEDFIAEFLHDAERSEGSERTHCKVTNGLGDDQVQVILQIDGKPVATHVFSRASEEWREFRRNLANRLGITSRIDFGVPLGPLFLGGPRLTSLTTPLLRKHINPFGKYRFECRGEPVSQIFVYVSI